MIQAVCSVRSNEEVADNTFVLSFHSPELAARTRAGQFLNLRVADATEPLLRRPFSVYRTVDDRVEIIFNVIGKGSNLLRQKQPGDVLDVIGPLGVPFSLTGGDFETAILVGGGLGVAPLPIATAALAKSGKRIVTFLGARSAGHLVEKYLEHLSVATDDGSKGYHGTVVDLLARRFGEEQFVRPKIFACGPTRMLHPLASFALKNDIPCEVSLEGPMACGFGICQGCPVEVNDPARKYALMCKDGPTFDVRTIRI